MIKLGFLMQMDIWIYSFTNCDLGEEGSGVTRGLPIGDYSCKPKLYALDGETTANITSLKVIIV